MLMFCIFLAATYLAVRLNRIKMFNAFLLGSIITSMSYFLYSTSRGSSSVQAFGAGLVLGIILSAISAMLGNIFGAPTTADAETIPAYIETRRPLKRTV
jgi:uncharacterized membrane protein YvlD (DUF360 family)